MTAQILELPVTLTSIDCGNCGGVYAINERYRRQRAEEGGFWHCPYCETSWGFAKDGSENARLKRELEAERARKQAALDRANAAEQSEHRLTKQVRSLKKRTANGVCPCCTRSFVNLQRHMTTQHPDYAVGVA
jgi:hypothetical protein